jgi:23S rRNA pseudouridine2457 synthase
MVISENGVRIRKVPLQYCFELALRTTVKNRYILLNKPYGVLSQFSPSLAGQRTLKDLVPIPDVYAAGRLDQDSEGLLLLTSDGRFQHALTDPKFGHPRTYWAQIEGLPDDGALDRLRNGIELNRYKTRAAKVRRFDTEPGLWPRNPPVRYRASIPTSWIEITLTEGRNRQVRRMTAAVGFPTLRLVRVAIGSLELGDLQPGHWRELSAAELARTAREIRLM